MYHHYRVASPPFTAVKCQINSVCDFIEQSLVDSKLLKTLHTALCNTWYSMGITYGVGEVG